MEQNDSLKAELQNLSRLQTEQISILQNMSSKQSEQATLEQTKQAHQQANFNTPGMYQYSAPMQSNPFGTTPTSNPYGNPYGRTYGGINTSGRFGMLDVLSPNSQMSLTGRTLTSMDQSARFTQAGIAGVGAVASAGATWGLGAIVPGLAGMGLGMVGGVAAGAYVDAGIEEVKKNSALKKYLYKNSSMFIDSSESVNERGVSGFSRGQSEDAANFVRTMNDELFISDDDTMMLLQKFTEGGLLKESKDLDTFKEKMVSLSKTVKEGALMLNETYDSIADLMAEMRAAGIDQKNFKDIMSGGGILGSLFGKDGSDTLRDLIEFIKNLNSGTGNDGDKTFGRVENTGIYMGQWYNDLKESKPEDLDFIDKQNLNMIENLGGPEEATKYTLSLMEKMVEKEQFRNIGINFFDYDTEKKEFQFKKDKFEDFLSNDYTLQEMYGMGTKKLQQYTDSGNGAAVTLWQNQFSSYFKDGLEDGDLASFINRSLKAYNEDPLLKEQGYDFRGILNMLGVSDAANQNLLTGFLEYKGQHPKLAKQVELQNIWQQETATNIAETPTFSESLKSGWEKIKDSATQWMVDIDTVAGRGFQKVQDWWTGTKPKPKYDTKFTTSSDIDNITYDEILTNTKQTNDILAAGFKSLELMKNNGFEIDGDVLKFMENKFKVSEKTVEYDRDIITNWDDLSKGLQENKTEINEIAKKNSLSETIVAALFKYNQQKPNDEKLKVTSTDDSFAQSLGQNVFNYGGNNQLALAASLSSTTSIDNALNKLGYNMNNLRGVGAQESVINVNLDQLGLDKELIDKVNEIMKQSLTDGSKGSKGTLPGSTKDMTNQDLTVTSNVTVEDINKLIDMKTANKPDSKLKGMGQTIMDAAKETGLDPVYLLAHAGRETAWGTSGILNDKYNWFGIGAYNSSPASSAYKYSDKNSGFIEGAKWIKEKYHSAGQNTLAEMINRPGHNYAVYDNGAPNTEWRDGIAQDIVWMLKKVDKGFGAEPGKPAGPGGAKTEKEKVRRDENGKPLTEEEIKVSDQDKWAKEGFELATGSEEYRTMDEFLTTVEAIDLVRSETSEERTSRIKESISNLPKGSIKKEKDIGYSNGGIQGNADKISDAVEKLIADLDKALDNDAYGGIDDIVDRDKGVKKSMDQVLSLFSDKNVGQEFLNSIMGERKIVEKGLGNNLTKYETLQMFGEKYLNIGREGLMVDSAQYNAAISSGANSFLNGGVNMIKEFLAGDKESAGYKAWAGKSASEKELFIETLKKVEYALGLDGEGSKVTEVLKDKSDDVIHTEEEIHKKKFIHKDENGKFYYDESKKVEEGSEASWDDYNTWVKQGQKKLSYGALSKLLSKEGISTTNESGVTLSIEDLIQKVNKSMNIASEKQYEIINGEANDLISGLKTGRENIIGMSNSEKKDLNSKDENIRKQGADSYNKFLEHIGNLIKTGDAGGLRELRESEAKNGRTFNDEEFNKFIELAEKIKSMDASEFMKIIQGLNEIVDRGADVAKTIALFTGSDGSGGLGEGFSAKFSEELIETIKLAFKGTDFGEKVSSGEYDVSEILEIVKNGGVQNGEVVLSPDSLDKIVLGMGEAMDKTFDERLKTTGGIEEFSKSALFELFKDGITIDINGETLNIEDAMTLLNNTAAAGTEASKEALSQRDEIIIKVKEAFQNQVDEFGELEGETKEKADASKANTAKTVDDFVTAIEKYDGAIQSAVKTLNGSVKSIDKAVSKADTKITKTDTKIENHINAHNPDWRPSGWFGSGSNGITVDPTE